MPAEDLQSQWRERLASGSKLAARALAQLLKDDPSRIPLIVPLTRDARPTVRISALRAIEEVAAHRAAQVAPHAADLVAALSSAEPDAQLAALGALTHVAPHAGAETALALPIVADLLRARRPSLREEAIRCLGRVGTQVPDHAPAIAKQLAEALAGARTPRASAEAREIIAALEAVLPNLTREERALLVAAVAPMRAHPNIQVRERAGRLARSIGP